jgi:hypothetical protein
MEVRERERKEMNSSGDRESENYTTGKKTMKHTKADKMEELCSTLFFYLFSHFST